MTTTTITRTNAGRSAVVAVDNFLAPFNVGLGADITAGTPTFNIEYSFDDPMEEGYSAATATWFIASGFSGATAKTGGSLTVPCKAVSINITTGSGTVSLQILQAGTQR
jgi:hypothetical protein